MERVLTRRTDQIQLSMRALSPFEGPAATAAATASPRGSEAGFRSASGSGRAAGVRLLAVVVVVAPVPSLSSLSSLSCTPSEAMPRF
jgi:hypothetical protein